MRNAQCDRRVGLDELLVTLLCGGAQRAHDALIFGGGVPLKVGGSFVGAVGASGGSVDNDVQIANAAAAALQ